MKYKKKILTFAFLTAAFSTPAFNDLFAQSDEYILPKDKKTPVVVLEYTGGFRMRTDEKPEPMLTIYPDGRVVAGKTSPQIKRVEWKMKGWDLQKLLKLCIKENGFMDSSTEKIKKAIADSGQRVMIADAPSTEITINTEEQKNKVSVYALMFVARDMKGIEGIKELANIERALKKVHSLAIIGGPEEFEKVIEFANKELQKKFPDSITLNADDLGYASARSDGKKTISLSRNKTDDKGRAIWMYNVNIAIDEDGKMEAGIFGRDNRKNK